MQRCSRRCRRRDGSAPAGTSVSPGQARHPRTPRAVGSSSYASRRPMRRCERPPHRPAGREAPRCRPTQRATGDAGAKLPRTRCPRSLQRLHPVTCTLAEVFKEWRNDPKTTSGMTAKAGGSSAAGDEQTSGGAHSDFVLMLGHAKAVVAGVVMVLAAGCGASSNSSSTSTQSSTNPSASQNASPAATKLVVNGKHTTLAFTPAAASELRANGISVGAVAPATIAKPALVNMPVYVGEVTIPGLQGTISHHGGMTFTHSGHTVSATDFVISTAAASLTAMVDGQRVPLLHLTLTQPSTSSNGEFFLNGIVAKLTQTTALLLDRLLVVHMFTAGQQLGTVSTLLTGTQGN